jgi:hypothetical protein
MPRLVMLLPIALFCEKSRYLVNLIPSSANHEFKFEKRRQLLVRVHNETFSVVAMCVCNEDRSPVGINR